MTKPVFTPTYRPTAERLAIFINQNPDTIATVVLALTTLIGLTAALVLHPALYLVP